MSDFDSVSNKNAPGNPVSVDEMWAAGWRWNGVAVRGG